eukprot:107312_1
MTSVLILIALTIISNQNGIFGKHSLDSFIDTLDPTKLEPLIWKKIICCGKHSPIGKYAIYYRNAQLYIIDHKFIYVTDFKLFGQNLFDWKRKKYKFDYTLFGKLQDRHVQHVPDVYVLQQQDILYIIHWFTKSYRFSLLKLNMNNLTIESLSTTHRRATAEQFCIASDSNNIYILNSPHSMIYHKDYKWVSSSEIVPDYSGTDAHYYMSDIVPPHEQNIIPCTIPINSKYVYMFYKQSNDWYMKVKHKIRIYDTTNGIFDTIALPPDFDCPDFTKATAIAADDKIYLHGCISGHTLIFNTKNEKFEQNVTLLSYMWENIFYPYSWHLIAAADNVLILFAQRSTITSTYISITNPTSIRL